MTFFSFTSLSRTNSTPRKRERKQKEKKMASSQSLVKRTTDTQLMPPPPPTKKIKRPTTVLDEDSYTDALSHIIARDYFPGLLETQTRQEVLDALESRDKQWIARAGQRLEEVMTPGRGRKRRRRGVSMTPAARTANGVAETPTTTTTMYGGDTPMSTTASKIGTPMSVVSTTTTTTTTNKEREQGAIDVSNLSLNAFQAKYTSEDNESFNKVLDTQNDKRREKYAWMWNGNKILSARQIAHRQRETKRIADRGDAVGGSKELVVAAAALSTDMDARPAAPDTWKVGAQNSLMFSPEETENYETRAQKAEASSRAGHKQVIYENTRLPSSSTAEQDEQHQIPPSPSLSAIKDAIAGRIRPTESEPGYTGGETPRVNGYAFVDEEDEDDQDEAMYERLRQLASHGMTGDGGDSSPNPFNIKQNRKREDLHHRMVDTVAQKKRAEKAAPHQPSSSTPRFPSSPMFLRGTAGTPRGNNMTPGKTLTPAAQKLLQRVGNTPRRAGASTPSSSGLKNIWTPTPRRHK
jgi:protein DGCR14